jgi:hypothetical protein
MNESLFKLPDSKAIYTAEEMWTAMRLAARMAFVAGARWQGCGDVDCEAEALRRYPDKEDKHVR